MVTLDVLIDLGVVVHLSMTKIDSIPMYLEDLLIETLKVWVVIYRYVILPCRKVYPIKSKHDPNRDPT